MSLDLQWHWSITIKNNTKALCSLTANINETNLSWILVVAGYKKHKKGDNNLFGFNILISYIKPFVSITLALQRSLNDSCRNDNVLEWTGNY